MRRALQQGWYGGEGLLAALPCSHRRSVLLQPEFFTLPCILYHQGRTLPHTGAVLVGTTRPACRSPEPHLDDGLHPAGWAGGGPAGSLHCVRTEAPGDVRHGLGETEALV